MENALHSQLARPCLQTIPKNHTQNPREPSDPTQPGSRA